VVFQVAALCVRRATFVANMVSDLFVNNFLMLSQIRLLSKEELTLLTTIVLGLIMNTSDVCF